MKRTTLNSLLLFGLALHTIAFAQDPEPTLVAPGEVVPVFESYETNAFAPNPLFLTSLPEKPWWNDKAEARVPVLVTEPIGLERIDAPVSVFWNFPAGVRPDSIRVVTPYGKELPSQTRLLNAANNHMEVVFLITTKPGGQIPVFIYYGKQPIASTLSGPADEVLSIRETPVAYLLVNRRLTCEINKVVGTDGMGIVRVLKPLGAEHNQVRSGGGAMNAIRIVEDGPVRKTLAVGTNNPAPEISLYAHSPLVSGVGADYLLPGGDTLNDLMFYESIAGLRKLPIDYMGGNTPSVQYMLAPHLKEGWLFFLDTVRNEMVGKFYDAIPRMMRVDTHSNGYFSYDNAAGVQRYALFADRQCDILAARREYIAWKNPLIASVGAAQPFARIVPRVPVFGQDFLRMHIMNISSFWRRTDTNTVVRLRDWVVEHGANSGIHWSHWYDCPVPETTNWTGNPIYMDEIVSTFHASGLAVFQGHDRLIPPANARALAEHKLDGLWLHDEWAYYWSELTEADKAEFTKLTGLAVPAPGSSDLTKPDVYQMFRYMTDKTKAVLKASSDAALAVNTNILRFSTTSPGNLLILPARWGINDLEELGDVLSSHCIDIYSYDPGFVQNMVRIARGGAGNRKAVFLVSGYCGFDSRELVERNHDLLMMYGGNSLAYFILDRPSNPAPGDGAMYAFNFIDYTGLEKQLVRSWPMEFLGLVRDRTEFYASLKRGEYTPGRDSDYDMKLKQYMLALGAIPANFVYSKFLKPDLVAPYKVLLAPSAPEMAPESAQALKQYVEAGGNLILEGECVSQPALAQLAGVKKAGDKITGATTVTGAQSPVQGIAFVFTGSRVPVKAERAQVLATFADGAPAITLAEAGKGRVVYIAPLVGLQADTIGEFRAMLAQLVEHVAGYVPVKVEPATLARQILTSVLTDGTNALVCAFNHSSQKPVQFSLRLAGLDTNATHVMSMKTGRIVPLVEGVAANLGLAANGADYFRLGTLASLSLPAALACTNTGIGQAQRTGMTFLKQDVSAISGRGEKRTKEADTLYVGVFKMNKLEKNKEWCEIGANAILAEAAKLPKVKAEFLENADAATLDFYDVVIMPNMYDDSPLPKGWEKAVRQYVERGGGALLMHHAVGYRESSDASLLFPEIGKGRDFTAIRKIQVVNDHPVISSAAFHARFKSDLNNPAFAAMYNAPVMKMGDVMDAGFPDYIAIQEGPEGVVVARGAQEGSKGGTPAVVVGKVGKGGRVVLSGMDMGCNLVKGPKGWTVDESLTPGERNLLVNSIYWLGENVE